MIEILGALLFVTWVLGARLLHELVELYFEVEGDPIRQEEKRFRFWALIILWPIITPPFLILDAVTKKIDERETQSDHQTR